MTLNQVKLTSHIINKFTEQVKPSNQLRIESKELFTDRTVFITDHALMRLNERLELNKEKAEYSQFIRSMIYGTTKTFVTYKNERIFIANIPFGEVDMTLAFTRTGDEKNYLLITAFINSTSRFVEFMKKEYTKESKLHEVEDILKDSFFGGKSSEEFFNEFETKFGLGKHEKANSTKDKKAKHPKRIKRHKQPDKEIYSQKLDEKYAEELLKAIGLNEEPKVQIKKVEMVQPVNAKNNKKHHNKPKKQPVNKSTKLHNQKYDDNYAKQLLDSVGLEETVVVQPKKPTTKKLKKINKEVKLHNQSLDDSFMDELLNSNTLVQQSVEDIIEVEEVMHNDPIIREDDIETKIPEQKEIVTQELNEEFMEELLGDI
ncbi:hypothetical protein [Mycoplasma todarodis]|uniref:Uncharacterized protein n=1 Tax=Mycoplasma todarodis TaxID=1937191 RepID=A0A4V2NI50_9MOLU|nr:hypothetical protein [Mycoplasma todarodis]TCG11558.1 hypothetical protein C4B25_01090 [Mycoplasma todarodis]